MFSTAIDAFANLGAVQVSITVDGETASGVCSGIEETWTDSDYGAIRRAEGIQAYCKTEPEVWNGKKVIGRTAAVVMGSENHTMRIIGRQPKGGIYMYTLATENAAR